MAEENANTEKDTRMAEKRKELAMIVTPKLKQIADLYKEVSDDFTSIADEKSAEFFSKKAQTSRKHAGWFDPKAKKQAKAEKLREQLEALEAELAGATSDEE